MTIIGLFGALILIALVVWAVPKVCAAIGVPANIATIIYVALVCIVVLWIVSTFFGVGPGVRLR